MGTVSLDLGSLVTNGVLVAHKQLVISARQPVGLAVAEDVVLVISQGNVLRFSKQGEARGHLISPQPLKHPSDILRLSSGRLAVAHAEGVAFFSQECEFLRNFDKVGGNCYGLAEDEEGHLLTICVNMGSKKAGLTEPGMTDVIYIDTFKDKVVKRIELVDVIQEEERMETKCRLDPSRPLLIYFAPEYLQVYCIQQWQGLCWRHWEKPCVCSRRHNGGGDNWGNW